MSIIVNMIAAILLTVLPVSAPCACNALTFFCQCDSAHVKTLDEPNPDDAAQDKAPTASVTLSCCGGMVAATSPKSAEQVSDDAATASISASHQGKGQPCPKKQQKHPQNELSANASPSVVQVTAPLILSNFLSDPIPARFTARSRHVKQRQSAIAWPAAYRTPPPLGLIYAHTQRLLL